MLRINTYINPKAIIIFLLNAFWVFACNAQKPVIDSNTIKNWSHLANPSISSEGKYITYTIEGMPAKGHTLVLQSVKEGWKKSWPGATSICFSNDEKQFIYETKDTLCFLSLNSGETSFIKGVWMLRQPKEKKGQWLAYLRKNDPKHQLMLRQLVSVHEQIFESVSSFSFDDAGKVLILHTTTKKDTSNYNNLVWVNLAEGIDKTIWSDHASATTSNEIFDNDSHQLAFIVQSKESNNSIWYYEAGMEKAVVKVNQHTAGLNAGLEVDKSIIQFNKSGDCILFKLEQQMRNMRPDPNAVSVDVWSYSDPLLQSVQLRQSKEQPTYPAVIGVGGDMLYQLQQNEGESVIYGYGKDLDHFIISNYHGSDKYWERTKIKYWLSDLKSGKSILMSEGQYIMTSISPDERWVIYLDRITKQCYSYEISTGKTKVISSPFFAQVNHTDKDQSSTPWFTGIAGWFEDASRLLVYDNYDIWSLDPTGLNPAINLTNGYGQRNHISLRLLEKVSATGLKKESPLLLIALNEKNKDNGFYRAMLIKKADPEKLFMEHGRMYHDMYQNEYLLEGDMMPLKALNDNSWLVEHRSSTDAPNYFLTKDFKSYQRLTNLQPQKDYNWLSTELINYTQLDGKPTQAIVYKPENFNSLKKYPVLFNYYEKMTQLLNQFPEPEYTGTNINIPWFVSRGYIVVTPDIYYAEGRPGQSAYNSIVAAAEYLSKLPYIDAKKMGIQGLSFGSFETNYIITHTNLFAAACSSSGYSNMVSWYGGLWGGTEGDNGLAEYTELGQGRMGVSLWQNQQRYLDNSPILRADKVGTPLLMMYNKKDGTNFPQGLAFFTGLRRLNKKAWMLQYDNGGHGVNGKDAIDYTNRVEQFFDHYLKGAPAPIWMTRGVPARLKQIETGLGFEENEKNEQNNK